MGALSRNEIGGRASFAKGPRWRGCGHEQSTKDDLPEESRVHGGEGQGWGQGAKSKRKRSVRDIYDFGDISTLFRMVWQLYAGRPMIRTCGDETGRPHSSTVKDRPARRRLK